MNACETLDDKMRIPHGEYILNDLRGMIPNRYICLGFHSCV